MSSRIDALESSIQGKWSHSVVQRDETKAYTDISHSAVLTDLIHGTLATAGASTPNEA